VNWNRNFSKEVQMANKCMKKYPTSMANKENTNQNLNKSSPHSIPSGYHQEHKQQPKLVRIWGKRNPYTLLVGM
jgi:hypothetical protein